jgi:hypothetical protein
MVARCVKEFIGCFLGAVSIRAGKNGEVHMEKSRES